MLEPISRNDAKAKGLRNYFTDEPCRNGHLAERRVANTKCLTCEAQSNAKQRQLRPADPVRRAKDAADWRARNPGVLQEQVRRWRLKNPERYAEQQRAARQRNPHSGRASCAKRRAARLQATLPGHDEALREIYRNCPAGYEVDHVIPLRGRGVCGLHVPWNLQYLTPKANREKGNRF